MDGMMRWGAAAMTALAFAVSAAPAQAQFQIAIGFGGRPAPQVRPQLPPPMPTYHLGVAGREINGGFQLTRVDCGSPAERAGLEPGDVIHRANGHHIHCEFDLRRAVASSPDGCLDLKVHDARTQRHVEIHVDLAAGWNRGPGNGGGYPGGNGGYPGNGYPGNGFPGNNGNGYPGGYPGNGNPGTPGGVFSGGGRPNYGGGYGQNYGRGGDAGREL